MNDKNKTILVAYFGRRGGGAAYSYEMTKGLIDNGYRVRTLISDKLENKTTWHQLGNATIEELKIGNSIPDMVVNTFAFAFKYCKRIRNEYLDIDAVYIPMIHPWMRFLIKTLESKQIIFTLHDPKPHSTGNIIKWVKERSVLSIKGIKIDDMIILSTVFKEYVSKEYHIPESRIHVIPHGPFNIYREIDDGSSHKYAGKNNFLFLGNINKYKGLNVLAEAYRIVTKRIEGCTLTVAGSGDFTPYEDQYNDLNNINILNEWISDKKIMSFFRCDSKLVLVAPYIDATQSGVIPIAMENGIPVIASDAGGLAEQIDYGESGILFRTGDPEALAVAMEKSVTEDLSVLINNAKKHMDRISWDNLSRQLGDIVR